MANRKERMSAVLDLKGLDLVTPVDLLADGRTPYSKNFRLYAQQKDDRRVAVSSRKGPGFYSHPLGGSQNQANTSTAGASSVKLGLIGAYLQPFTATNAERVSRVDISIKDVEQASGPVLVQLYSDNSGTPGKLLSESSLLSGDIGSTADYVTARFINAVQLVNGAQYWLVLRMQDDGKNHYDLTTTTSGTKAWFTTSSLNLATQQTYALNYRIYTVADNTDKNAYRFNRDNGDNITVAAFGTTMYRFDVSTSTFIPILTGLNANATEYRFTNGDNKVFWVNGYDQLTAWDGTIEALAANLIGNPSFTTNTAGWTAGAGTTIARATSDFNTTPASLQVAASSGIRTAQFALTLNANTRYKVSYWVKGVSGTGNSYLTVNNVGTALSGSLQPMTTAWVKREYYIEPTVDVTTIEIRSQSDNFFLDDVSITPTGIEYIIDPELPILSDVIMHKDRLWGVAASDPNKLVFSENPGNPAYDPTGKIPTTSREQWYHAWLSVSYWYVPRPHNGSPITSLTSFQDALTITTQDNKYVLSGYDRGSLNLRQSTGNKGALSRRGVTSDENTIVLVSDDGFYLHNGSSDEKISTLINPLFDACPRKDKITPVIWKGQIRFYMASEGSTVNDICVIYDKNLKEWVMDTDVYANRALYYNDADDQHQLVEFSSVIPTAYLAEQDYNNLGGPIDFEYRLKYDSMGSPMQRKRLKRFYPILQGVDSTFNLQLAMDKDFENSPKIKDQLLTTNGAKLGAFKLGDGTVLGSSTSFKPKRQSYSGYAYYWQLRVKRKAVNNRVAFIGAQFSYKTKRL